MQSTGRIVLIDVAKRETLVSSKWTNHTGRITSLDFSANGDRIVSGALDEAIYVWHVKKTLKNIPIKVCVSSIDYPRYRAQLIEQNAHPGGVSGVAWSEGNEKIISAGADGCVRTWTVPEI